MTCVEMVECVVCHAPIENKPNGPRREYCSQKCRREKYRGTCTRCGGSAAQMARPTSGDKSGIICLDCHHIERHENGRAAAIDSIRDWHSRYGEVPSAADWQIYSPSVARRYSVERLYTILERHRDRDWPHPHGVLQLFGSWNAAIKAAGLEPVRRGGKHRRVA